MKTDEVSFEPGDVVTLKGQTHVYTISPPPGDQTEKEGFIWAAQSHSMGVVFSLLPIAGLALVEPVRDAFQERLLAKRRT